MVPSEPKEKNENLWFYQEKRNEVRGGGLSAPVQNTKKKTTCKVRDFMTKEERDNLLTLHPGGREKREGPGSTTEKNPGGGRGEARGLIQGKNGERRVKKSSGKRVPEKWGSKNHGGKKKNRRSSLRKSKGGKTKRAYLGRGED